MLSPAAAAGAGEEQPCGVFSDRCDGAQHRSTVIRAPQALLVGRLGVGGSPPTAAPRVPLSHNAAQRPQTIPRGPARPDPARRCGRRRGTIAPAWGGLARPRAAPAKRPAAAEPARTSPGRAGPAARPAPAASPRSEAPPAPPHLLVFAEHFLQQVPGAPQGSGAAQRPAPPRHRRRPGAPHSAAAARHDPAGHGDLEFLAAAPAVPAPPRGAAGRAYGGSAEAALRALPAAGGKGGGRAALGHGREARAGSLGARAGGRLIDTDRRSPCGHTCAQALLSGS